MPTRSDFVALNLSAPVLGDAPIGQPVSVDLGTWAPGTSLTADLLRDGVVVQTGLQGDDIVFTAADDEASLVLRVAGLSPDGQNSQVATSAPVMARYAPPQVDPSQVPQVPEIYDENTGPQTLDLSPAFVGEALLFTATGLTAAVIDAATGVLTVSTDVPIASGEVIVTAQNSGGSATVAVEIIVEDEGDTVLTPTSLQTSVTDPSTGHVYNFVEADGVTPEAREVWNYIDGSWGVLGGVGNPVRIGSTSPASTSISTAAYTRPDNLDDTATVGARTRWMHGMMLNPWAGVGTPPPNDAPGSGFDNYFGSAGNGIPYEHALNVDPGATGAPVVVTEGTLVKGESFPQEGGHSARVDDKTRMVSMSFLTVAPEIPAANPLRPGPRAPSKVSPASLSDAELDARIAALSPQIAGFRPFTPEEINTSATRIGHFQQTFMPFQEPARRINPGARGYGLNIYGDSFYFSFGRAFGAFLGDYTPEERRDIVRATVQLGVDIYGLLQDDSFYYPWQAHHAGRKSIVVLAGLMTQNQDILDQCDYDLHPEHFGVDDAYCGYVTQEMVGIQPNFYKGAFPYQWEDVHVGQPEWSAIFPFGDVNGVGDAEQVVDPDIARRSYQVLSVDNFCMYQPLFGMIVDPTAQYYNPAYFDFIDRYLAIRFGDQIDGMWDASSSEAGTNDHFTGNWWSINPSNQVVQDFKTMRDASSRPNAISSLIPEALPKPTVTHDGTSGHLDVDFNINNFQSPQNKHATITGYDLRWTAYAGGADAITAQNDPAWVGNFEWKVIEDVTLPYQLTGVPRGLKAKVQLRMKNVNGPGPWLDDRYRENYRGNGSFDVLQGGTRYSTNFDVPDIAAFDTAPQNFALPTTSPASLVTGGVISGVEGIWTDNPAVTATDYQWQASDDGLTGWADISGATGIDFTATAAQEGKHVRLGVRKANSVGAAAWSYSATTTAVSEPLAVELAAYANGESAFDPGAGALGGKKLLVLFMTRADNVISLGGTIGAYSFTDAQALFSANGGGDERQAIFLLDVPAGETASTITFNTSLAGTVCAAYEMFTDLELIEAPFEFDGNAQATTEAGGMAFFMVRSASAASFTSSSELAEHTGSAASSDGYWAVAQSFATIAGTAQVRYSQAFASNTRAYLATFRVV